MSSREAWQLSYILFPALVLVHLYISPYTKVEESFNIQAIHDILKYGVPTHNVYLKLKAQYDHMTFRGAVPRTFIGALVVATAAQPIVWMWPGQLDGEQQQMLVRALLGLFNAAALISYASGVRRAYGKLTAAWYTALQASQFHLLYYSSRTLPNMFAFGISTFALRFLLPSHSTPELQAKHARLALYLLTLATVIFRSELALLLGSQCLYMLWKTRSVASAMALIRRVFLPAIVAATIAGLLLTVAIDTYFWQSPRLLWPELAAFLSNVFPSQDSLGASAWGTAPWHWYFTSALPRLLSNPVLLLILPLFMIAPTALRPQLADLIIPSLGYICLYSFLPHKETRFLFPVVPPIAAAAALCANYMFVRRGRSLFFRLSTYLLVLSTAMAAIFSHGVLLPLSAQTYPAAHALKSLHSLTLNYGPQPVIRVHLTNLALQTGVTRFLESPPPHIANRPVFTLPGSADGRKPTITSTRPTAWIYDKSDNSSSEFLSPDFWSQFDYVVVEDPEVPVGGVWDVVDKVPALGRPKLLNPSTGRGLLVLGPPQKRREDDGLSRLAEAMYGNVGKWVYGVLHDLIREGFGAEFVFDSGWSWTKGWWLHWGLEPKLYILKKARG
ncbi:alpha-1,6- mannosyltransferase [Exophiala dermatitidis]|uniref:Mannosyltransferase n=2 Tax=Exophiala dermatitidis TaxID=5970 RepID=H6BQT8_EXODN|nr:alpha-1,6-mannosyltransferase [Exophiala dermatitidis NIH/UT8656]KAJ4515787.1 alpha-1,6- mannosyltransferase [Exophiala dermatitidis]EHY53851.1 alpha-1,6-mannosyltransferase [Exophiala dermatitidis NIH/UT8656]KAJ4519480.1 alpha-1,6- mannosyltransferase [Exophiala dermatitidis]KAJ4529296.1 alpha-1,6- mannosyltransferase [Exophiala dermatitidis]KAJ4544050.1 alpha-1,6- mannosyltransferase [Exophiala dermatitidis]